MTVRRWDGRRVYAALVIIPLLYALVRYAPPEGFFVLIATAALLTVAEFYRLHFREHGLPAAVMTLGFSITILLMASMQWPSGIPDRAFVLAIVIIALIHRLYARRTMTQGLMDPAIVAFGPLYIGLCLGHLLLLRTMTEGEFLIVFVCMVTWMADAGAYYVGMSLGRHKLAPSISPNKTVEGFIGGLAFAVITALVARVWYLPSFTMVDSVVTGCLLTVAGLLGDLAESAMKRGAGVKDTGGLIPGHGGMLDRLDSLLFTAPAFYYYVTLMKG